jgi:hypothetical protein
VKEQQVSDAARFEQEQRQGRETAKVYGELNRKWIGDPLKQGIPDKSLAPLCDNRQASQPSFHLLLFCFCRSFENWDSMGLGKEAKPEET